MLLNTVGRTQLVNSVLSGQLVYAMCATKIPIKVIETIDARRRSFLWSGSDHTSGMKCLVSWDKVCRGRQHGGLGVNHMQTHNTCLMLKLVHKML